MRAFIKLVLETGAHNLSRPYKKAFVLARCKGVPAIHRAMKEGNTETAIAYAEAIVAAKHSSIGSASKRYLLEAKDRDGKSAIDVAIEAGHIEIAKAYSKAISAYVTSDRPELIDLPKVSNVSPTLPPLVPEIEDDLDGFNLFSCTIC